MSTNIEVHAANMQLGDGESDALGGLHAAVVQLNAVRRQLARHLLVKRDLRALRDANVIVT